VKLPSALVACALTLPLTTTIADAQSSIRPPVAISRHLAEARHLSIGSTIRLSTDHAGTQARDFTIVGIYEPTPNPARLGRPISKCGFISRICWISHAPPQRSRAPSRSRASMSPSPIRQTHARSHAM
jgi:hypothetical protein